MNLLANLSATYRQSILLGDAEGINEAYPSGNRPVPPYAEMMGTLEGLRQNDPTLYQRVKREVASSVQAATQAADDALDIRTLVRRRRTPWNEALADRLNRLAYLLFPGVAEPLTPRGRV